MRNTTAENNRVPAADGTRDANPPIILAIPADRDYVVLVRSAAGHLGARAGLTLVELDDLRLAVDEACSLLLLPDEIAVTGETLVCTFADARAADDASVTADAGAALGALRVTLSAEAVPGSQPQVGGFGWNLLSALVDELEWSVTGGHAVVTLVKRAAALTS